MQAFRSPWVNARLRPRGTTRAVPRYIRNRKVSATKTGKRIAPDQII